MINRILAVIRREYLERVRTKAFWISTILVPIFLGAVMIVPAWLAARGGGEFSVAVLDLSGRFFDPVQDEVGRLLSGDDEKLSVTLHSQEPGPNVEATRERLKNEVQNKEFDGLLVIPASMPDEGQPDYVAPNVAAFKLLTVIERSVNNVMVADRLTDAGLDPEAVRELTRRVGLNTLKLGKGGEETSDQGQTFMLAYVFMMIIYMTVLMYGIYVMRGVLEEKSSHVVEVIISTVKPFELMLGKILGIGAVGLTQFLIWAALDGGDLGPRRSRGTRHQRHGAAADPGPASVLSSLSTSSSASCSTGRSTPASAPPSIPSRRRRTSRAW